jgi:hypothetical protein
MTWSRCATSGTGRAGRRTSHFVAYCECGWVSETRDETDPEAEQTVFTDARRHGSKVAPDVRYPLG